MILNNGLNLFEMETITKFNNLPQTKGFPTDWRTAELSIILS